MACPQSNAASNALNARLTTNSATHQANQAAAQQAGVTTIDTLLDNDYTAFLTAQFAGQQTAATNLLTEMQDWVLDNIGSNVAYAAIAAVASNTYSSLRESTIFAHNLLAASSLKQAEDRVAGSYKSNGSQLADAIAAYQIAEAQALRDHRIAIEQADRRFADNGDTTAHNTAIETAHDALDAARETFTEAYYKAAIGAQGAHQSTVAKTDAQFENNVGQSRAQSTKTIADAQVDYVTTEAAAYRNQQETIAARDKEFAEFGVDNDYDSLVDALAALTAANNDTADPWTTKALAVAAAVQDAATDIAAGIYDYDLSQAAASEASDVASAEADRDRTVGEVKADVGKAVSEKSIAADRVTKEAVVQEMNADMAAITNAWNGNVDKMPNEGKSAYANLPVKIPENLMRPTETTRNSEEVELGAVLSSETGVNDAIAIIGSTSIYPGYYGQPAVYRTDFSEIENQQSSQHSAQSFRSSIAAGVTATANALFSVFAANNSIFSNSAFGAIGGVAISDVTGSQTDYRARWINEDGLIFIEFIDRAWFGGGKTSRIHIGFEDNGVIYLNEDLGGYKIKPSSLDVIVRKLPTDFPNAFDLDTEGQQAAIRARIDSYLKFHPKITGLPSPAAIRNKLELELFTQHLGAQDPTRQKIAASLELSIQKWFRINVSTLTDVIDGDIEIINAGNRQAYFEGIPAAAKGYFISGPTNAVIGIYKAGEYLVTHSIVTIASEMTQAVTAITTDPATRQQILNEVQRQINEALDDPEKGGALAFEVTISVLAPAKAVTGALKGTQTFKVVVKAISESDTLSRAGKGLSSSRRSRKGMVLNPFADPRTKPSTLVVRIQAKLDLYPKVVDARTGRNIPFPSEIKGRVDRSLRVSWDSKMDRAAFISDWHRRGYATPKGGWDKYDIHHIHPREFGGTNDFWNLVPVERVAHQNLFNEFWREFVGL
ncbi:HNH endonuclease signature motif containing protein [Blastopirellula marina]|uniref:HNH nuclease domain-containing protein n=1 Tax=Blastopirellula marina DSM 3645 TaxID=314230 RepID=A3ZWD7_9BACT|nr:HNH endonuclease signature motif containing protein [Blastopirellula marina]EAQ79165.1 hypothetical protein DSM3645_26119 [Blastopirellula marina DSM 3645]